MLTLNGCFPVSSAESELRTVANTPYGVGVNAGEWPQITVGSQALCVIGTEPISLDGLTWTHGNGVEVVRFATGENESGSTVGAVDEPMEALGYSDEDREISAECGKDGQLGDRAALVVFEVRSMDPTIDQRVEGLEIHYRSRNGSEHVITEPFTMIICAEANMGKSCEDD